MSGKKLSDLTEEEIIDIHIGEQVGSVKLSDFEVVSTLCLARESMRCALGNLRTRFVCVPMAAFAILDQLGGCYSLKE